jgi:hypothetical protein
LVAGAGFDNGFDAGGLVVFVEFGLLVFLDGLGLSGVIFDATSLGVTALFLIGVVDYFFKSFY